jgi:hypothetical protein
MKDGSKKCIQNKIQTTLEQGAIFRSSEKQITRALLINNTHMKMRPASLEIQRLIAAPARMCA